MSPSSNLSRGTYTPYTCRGPTLSTPYLTGPDLTPISGAALERACSEDLLRVGSHFSSDGTAFYVNLRREDGYDVAMQVLDRTISVYAAVGMKLEQDAGLLIVGYGGDPIKWGERFVDIYGIEDGATLSVRKNEDAIHALEEVLQLGPESCTSTEIILAGNRSVIRLPRGTLLLNCFHVGINLTTPTNCGGLALS